MVDRLDVGHADIEGHADCVRVGGGAIVTVGTVRAMTPPPAAASFALIT
jgi:hypothetical protein